jgi:hypothetical protein
MELTINLKESYIKIPSGVTIKELMNELDSLGLDYDVINRLEIRTEDNIYTPPLDDYITSTFKLPKIFRQEIIKDQFNKPIATLKYDADYVDEFIANDFSESFTSEYGSCTRHNITPHGDLILNMRLCELKEAFSKKLTSHT